MAEEQKQPSIISVPQQAFSQFISALEKKSISPEIIKRLKEKLIDKNDTSETAMRDAFFTETFEA